MQTTYTLRIVHIPSAFSDKGQYVSVWTDIRSDHTEMCTDTGSVLNSNESRWLLPLAFFLRSKTTQKECFGMEQTVGLMIFYFSLNSIHVVFILFGSVLALKVCL